MESLSFYYCRKLEEWRCRNFYGARWNWLSRLASWLSLITALAWLLLVHFINCEREWTCKLTCKLLIWFSSGFFPRFLMFYGDCNLWISQRWLWSWLAGSFKDSLKDSQELIEILSRSAQILLDSLVCFQFHRDSLDCFRDPGKEYSESLQDLFSLLFLLESGGPSPVILGGIPENLSDPSGIPGGFF